MRRESDRPVGKQSSNSSSEQELFGITPYCASIERADTKKATAPTKASLLLLERPCTVAVTLKEKNPVCFRSESPLYPPHLHQGLQILAIYNQRLYMTISARPAASCLHRCNRKIFLKIKMIPSMRCMHRKPAHRLLYEMGTKVCLYCRCSRSDRENARRRDPDPGEVNNEGMASTMTFTT